jgi:hypothetical protein
MYQCDLLLTHTVPHTTSHSRPYISVSADLALRASLTRVDQIVPRIGLGRLVLHEAGSIRFSIIGVIRRTTIVDVAELEESKVEKTPKEASEDVREYGGPILEQSG